MNKHPTFLLLLASLLASDLCQVIRVDRGLLLVQNLLKDAKFLHTFTYGEKVYVKKGGYRQALKDFQSFVDPNSVRKLNIGIGKQGTVGDKTVRLRDAYNGFVQMPTLSISNTKNLGMPNTIIKYRN